MAQRVRTGQTTTGHRSSRYWTADPDERRAWGPHSLDEHGGPAPRPNQALPTQVQPLLINAWSSRGGGFDLVCYVGSTNDSPLVSTAQAILAFLAAMATTAFQ